MKLIDKIKNYFYDEEDAVPEKKEVKVSPEVKSEPAPIKEPVNTNVDAISERELFKSDPTFNFPIIFDDEDFKEEKAPETRIKTTVTEQTKTVETFENHVFKPSPNISPIYGIIDSEGETAKTADTGNDSLLSFYDEKKKIDIDDVLGKVYEQSRVEIKKENYVETKEDAIDFFKNLDAETPIEETPSRIEIKKEVTTEVDDKLKSIDELLSNTDDEDFYSLVDSMYKDKEEEGDN